MTNRRTTMAWTRGACVLGLAIGWAARGAGPDIAIGDLNGFLTVGRVTDAGDDIWGFMFGKTDCNLGDEPVDVFFSSTRHPVVAEHLFRYAVVNDAGRFEQIGMSHVFHEFFPLQGTLCFSDCRPDANTARLGAHCSSPDSASAMAQTQQLGPRDEVNAFTGVFAFPFRPLPSPAPALARRIQARDQDIRPSLNPNARYVGEAHIISPDDAAAGNGANNASYRMLSVSAGTTITLTPFPGSTTRREQPAIRAWAELVPDVHVANLDVPGEGRFGVAWKVTQLAPCRWHYEYAIQNINSDRAGGSFALPVKAWMTIANVGFHAPERHSGDIFSNDDWVVTRTPTTLAWSSPRDFATDPNANALRWGTLYNFRFDSSQPPVMREASLALFKPGTPERVSLVLEVPAGCPADTDDGTNTGTPDCGVTIDDLLYYLLLYADGNLGADLDDGSATGAPDGGVTIDDLLYFLSRFAAGC